MTEGPDPIHEVRELWYQEDGSVIVYSHQVVPRRWWNRLTRPIGVLLIVLAVAWPALLLSHGWTWLGLAFATGDVCVVLVGRDLILWGARRWSDP